MLNSHRSIALLNCCYASTKLGETTVLHVFSYTYIYICRALAVEMYVEIEKFDVFRKVLNKQFIERLRAISIINKTQLQTPTDCFTPWGDHQGDHIQIGLFE